MRHVGTALDAPLLRQLLQVGGLVVSAERALAVLPVASALLAGCDRLATLDLAGEGGCGPAAAPDNVAR
jgi:hypothetical protein